MPDRVISPSPTLKLQFLQMLEYCVRRYELVILDGGFLCHGRHRNQKSAVQVQPNKLHRRLSYYTNIFKFGDVLSSMYATYVNVSSEDRLEIASRRKRFFVNCRVRFPNKYVQIMEGNPGESTRRDFERTKFYYHKFYYWKECFVWFLVCQSIFGAFTFCCSYSASEVRWKWIRFR